MVLSHSLHTMTFDMDDGPASEDTGTSPLEDVHHVSKGGPYILTMVVRTGYTCARKFIEYLFYFCDQEKEAFS